MLSATSPPFFSGLNIREGNKMSEWLWVQDLVNSVCKHPRSCITPGPYIICKDTTHHDPSVSEWTLYNKSSISRTTYTSTVSHDLDQERSLRNWILNTNFTHNINTTAVWKKNLRIQKPKLVLLFCERNMLESEYCQRFETWWKRSWPCSCLADLHSLGHYTCDQFHITTTPIMSHSWWHGWMAFNSL